MTTKKRTPWYFVPYVVLVVGIVLAGYVAWRMIVHQHATNTTNANVVKASCGDGICENVACQSTNCPKPETPESCPQDCSAIDVPTGSTDSGASNTNSTNTNVSTNGPPLRFVVAAQTSAQATLCPEADANMTAAEALAEAQRAGLTQGTKEVTIALYHYDAPLDQCVWGFRNYLTATSGVSIVVIDSTQEVFEKTAWGT